MRPLVMSVLLYLVTAFYSAMATEVGIAKRVALVIGNSDYKFASRLINPENDATDIGNTLKELGFTVILGIDLDKNNTEKILREFSKKLHDASVGVFFYAGHGLQVNGKNYIVPTDAQLNDEAGIDFELLPLMLVHRTMERQAKTSILFLDACQNNPLARNLARAMGTRSISIGRGLAPVESGVGTLISFSTQPNVSGIGLLSTDRLQVEIPP